MSENVGYQVLLVLFMVALNGFFAAAETALVSSRISRLRSLAGEGNVGAQAAINLLANSERLLSVVQVGVTICSLAIGALGESMLERYIEQSFQPLMQTKLLKESLELLSTILAYTVMTYIHVVIGEVVPKNVGIEKRERLAVIVAPPLLIFFRIAEPFVYVLEKSAAMLSRAIGLRGDHSSGHSVEELKFILAASLREGVIEGFAEKSMQRLIELQEYLTREIMVPRRQIISASVESTLNTLLRIANEHQYTRLPIYEGRPENLIGYIHVKDLLREWEDRRLATERRRSVRPFELRRILRILPIVPESKPVSQLMDDFRKSHSHIAMVVDEFGTIVGVVTLEDLVEQIFGEIEDEHDVRRPVIEHAADTIHIDGAMPIVDMEMQYGIELPSEAGYETLAGFLLFRLGHIPKAGEFVIEGPRRFIVEEMERNRIARVHIEKIPPEPQS